MMPLGDLRQDQDGNYIALNVEQKSEQPEDLSGRDTSDDKTTTDRRVPEGHSAVYCSSPPGREDSNVFLSWHFFCAAYSFSHDALSLSLSLSLSASVPLCLGTVLVFV